MKQTKQNRRRRYLRGRVKELRSKGMSHKEISLKLGISERSVYRITSACQNDAVVFFSEGLGFSNQNTKSMAVTILNTTGLSVSVTAWLFGRSPHTIARWNREVIRENTEKRVLGGAI